MYFIFFTGVGLMIWRTFLAERASAVAALMEKVGKAPKERLFTRDVQMSDTAVVAYLDLTYQFLTLIADVRCLVCRNIGLETRSKFSKTQLYKNNNIINVKGCFPGRL